MNEIPNYLGHPTLSILLKLDRFLNQVNPAHCLLFMPRIPAIIFLSYFVYIPFYNEQCAFVSTREIKGCYNFQVPEYRSV
jgi:ABC-type polysaccharide transport system permease subunit